MTFVGHTVWIFVSVWHDNVRLVGFHLGGQLDFRKPHHEQRLAESPRALPQYLIGIQGNDVAKRENEGMDVFHIQVISRHRIGDGVLGEDLRLFDCIPSPFSLLSSVSWGTYGVISSGSSSIGLYPNFDVVTALRP